MNKKKKGRKMYYINKRIYIYLLDPLVAFTFTDQMSTKMVRPRSSTSSAVSSPVSEDDSE